MAKEQPDMVQGSGGPSRSSRFLGSLKDALAAAGRDDHGPVVAHPADGARVGADARPLPAVAPPPPPPLPESAAPEMSKQNPDATQPMRKVAPATPSAAEAARDVKGQASLKASDRHLEPEPTTRVFRAAAGKPTDDAAAAKTQLVRGRQPLKRGEFVQDPVVGWLVIVGGPGLGSYRPIFEGNNTIGRAATNRIGLDFGDGAISAEEQAYIRYDAADRSFLFVPNMSKTNVVSVNDKRPTGAVSLETMDVIVMGRTQLVFVPFCGPDFDWSEITETKG